MEDSMADSPSIQLLKQTHDILLIRLGIDFFWLLTERITIAIHQDYVINPIFIYRMRQNKLIKGNQLTLH